MKLFDNILNAIATKRTKVSHKIEIGKSEDFYPSTIKPQTIKNAINQANDGKLQALQGLFDQLYKNDDNLAADTDVRTEAIKTAQYTLPDKLSTQQTEYFTEFLDKFVPDLIDQVMDYKLRGLVFRQIIYEMDEGKSAVYKVKSFLDYQTLDLRAENDEVVLYVSDEPVRLNLANFIAKFNRYPVYESLLRYYAFTFTALNHWAEFMETYGKPIRIGKYQSGTPQTEKDTLWHAIKSLGTDLAAMISEKTVIEFVEHKGVSASSDLYKDLLIFCQESVTKRILGQVLTTMSQDTGSYAQSQIHNLVRKDIQNGDLRDAGLYISEICTLLNRINFNDDEIVVKLHQAEPIDLASRIDIDLKLASVIEIDDDYFYETYGIPKPKNAKRSLKVEDTSCLVEGNTTTLNPQRNQRLHRANAKHSLNETEGCLNSEGVFNAIDIKRLKPYVEPVLNKYSDFIESLTSYENIINAPFPLDLYLEYGKQLTQAILDGYTNVQATNSTINPQRCEASLNARSASTVNIDWSQEDIEALSAFRAQAFVVAGVTIDKGLDELKQNAEQAFTKGLTFQKWRENIRIKGLSPFYLRTNFNTAINSAYQAREWNDLQSISDTFPYLQYVCISDSRVREEHLSFNGVVYHQDDTFWNENYPPNGWNCRCTVRPLTEEDARQQPRFEYDKSRLINKTHKDFMTNVGKNHEIWKIANGDVKKASYKYDELGLPKLQDESYEAEKGPELIKFKAGITKDELLAEYQRMLKELSDKGVIDKYKFPVSIQEDKWRKFDNEQYDNKIRDLINRISHFDYIEDTLKYPTETWLNAQEHKKIDIKKYSRESEKKDFKYIVVITQLKTGQFEYFNIIYSSKDDINDLRKGYLASY